MAAREQEQAGSRWAGQEGILLAASFDMNYTQYVILQDSERITVKSCLIFTIAVQNSMLCL